VAEQGKKNGHTQSTTGMHRHRKLSLPADHGLFNDYWKQTRNTGTQGQERDSFHR
jgi:hypothetical protein